MNTKKIENLAFALGVLACVSPNVMPTMASDYTLGIFGNANMDDAINEEDVKYVQGIIDGTNEATELADANYDGRTDEEDLTQIKLILCGEEKELTLVDSAERIVTVKKPIRRIVCCWYQPTEVMRTFGENDKIVGLSDYILKSEFFEDFSDIPSVGSPNTPNYEKILEFQPDVVFITKWSTSWEDVTDKFEPLDIKVLCFDFLDPETFVDEVRKTGYILDKNDRAVELIEFYQEFMDTIEKEVEELSIENKPKVYYEYKPYYALAGGTAWHKQIVMAGGINIFANEPVPFPQVNPEAVIEQNPDIIVSLSMGDGSGGGYNTENATELEAVRDEIMNRPELQNVNAVKTGRVYAVGGEYVFQGSPRHFVAIGYLAKWFHPELFEDLDPQAIHQEYLTRFQGLDIDLNEKGVFVYPPLEEC